MGLASKLAAAQANQAAQGAPPPGGFAPPSGPPPGAPYGGGYAPPSGPPPQTGHPAGGYAPPSGPPPPHLQARPQAGATAAAAAVDNTKVDMPTLMNILRHTVTEQKIGAFYKDKDLEGIAKRLLSTDVLRQIAARLRVPMSLGIDLAKVALFDVVLLCDDSMSMKAHQGGARIVELKKILSHITAACTLLDEDGIAIRFFNSNVEGNNIKSEGQISDLVDRAGNSSGTPIGTSLEEKVLKPLLLKPAKSMIKKLRKPLLVIVITDGAPYNEKGVKHNRDKLPQVIKHTMAELSRTKYGPDAVSYQFAQVGDDEQAREFLSNLDEDPVIGGFIDQTMGFEYEQDQMAKQGAELTPETWVMKLLLGPIDDSYDAQDEA